MFRNIQSSVKESIDPTTGSLTFPIHQTSAYLMPEGERYRYSRESNPTVEELSRVMAILEKGEAATSFSSGMGAISTTLLALSKPGYRILIHKDSFARTYKFVTEYMKGWNMIPVVAEPGNKALLEKAGEADIVLIESLTNPILRVYDIEAIANKVHEKGGLLIVDSTFATPINQRPLELGADVVIQSLSKFISGHNDTIAGSASGNKNLIEKIDNLRRTLGTSLDPNTAYLTLRGIKTLEVRMNYINSAAMKVATSLKSVNGFSNVRYPGLPEHPEHDLAKKTMSGFGGLVTFDVDAVASDPLKAMKKLKVVTPANTLGGSGSTISHPGTMSHRSLTKEEKDKLGITHGTFRLSVGLESPEDIVEDLLSMIS